MVMADRSQNDVRSAFDAFAKFAVPELPPLPPVNPESNRPIPPSTPDQDEPETPPPLFMHEPQPDQPPTGSRIAKLKDLHQRLIAPTAFQALDWRTALAAPIEQQNIDAIKQAGVIPAQYKVIELSQEADSEAIQLQASQFILAQNGHGQIQKTEHRIEYEQIPPNQLAPIVRAKFQRLLELNPNFKITEFLPSAAPPIEILPAQE